MAGLIDLTGLSDEEAPLARRAKRPRPLLPSNTAAAAGGRASFRLGDWQPVTGATDLVDLLEEEEQLPLRQQAAAGAAAAAAAAGAAAQLEDNEELAIVGATGQVWNTDLPHTRDCCGLHTFSKQPCAANSTFCAKCYCAICDCRASECQEWGSGGSAAHHCNAHMGDKAYMRMRTAHNAAQQENVDANAGAAAAAGPGGAAAGGRAGTARMDPAPKDGVALSRLLKMAAEREAERAAAAAAIGPPPAAAPANPATEPLRGTQHPPARVEASPPNQQACREVEMPDPAADPTLMELGTLELYCEAANGHTIPGIAARLAPNGFYLSNKGSPQFGGRLHIGNIRASKYDYATAKSIPEVLKLRPLPIPAPPAEPSPNRVRKVVIIDGRGPPTIYGLTVGKEATIEDIKAAAAPLAGLGDDEELLAVDQKRATLHTIPPETKITDKKSKETSLALWRLPKAEPSAPNYAVIYSRKHAPDFYYGYQYQSPVGHPTLVPLGLQYADGGKVAERVVLERLLAALAPLRAEGAPEMQVDDLLGAGMKLERITQEGYTYGTEFDLFRTTMNYNKAGRYGQFCYHDGKVFLQLSWADEILAHYNLDLWTTPAVHDSASPAAMKETEDYIAAYDAFTERQSKAASLPAMALAELEEATKARQPGVEYALYADGAKPLARARLELLPNSPDPAERKGRLMVTVWVWRTGSSTKRAFFKPLDDWTSPAAARYDGTNEGAFQMSSVMEVLLWRQPQAKAMKEKMEEWRVKDESANRSIKGLMDVLERGELPAAPQPQGLTVQMRPYQLQSLQFMLDAERSGPGGFRRFLFVELTTRQGQHWWYSPLLQRACLDVPAMPHGGMLADEMGLGKTVEILGLILSNPAPAMPAAGVQLDENGLIKSRATLVVCPVSLVGQWMSEAQAKLGGSLRMHMYHGQSRIKDPKKLATNFDLVVTTYATLNSDFSKLNGKGKDKLPAPTVNVPGANRFPPLGAIKWHRLVLDEGHTVKNPTVGHTRACMALQADRRWLASGTPVSSSVEDLSGQFCVLGLSPFNNANFFASKIKRAFGQHSWGNGLMLLYALGHCMVRHTKLQVLGGESVLNLPPLHQTDVAVVLTAQEQQLYRDTHTKAKAVFQQFMAGGNTYVNAHLLQIMALLLPMRRICSGGNLRPQDLEVAAAPVVQPPNGAPTAAAALPTVKDLGLVAPDDECAICIDAYEAPMVTPCAHWFCRECILGVINNNPKCPLCRAALAAGLLRAGVTQAEAAAAAAPAATGGVGDGMEVDGNEREGEQAAAPALVSESKLQALLKELRAMRRADASSKALIFSQYMSTIEWLKRRLTEEGFGYRFIAGSMPLKQRAKAIEAFQGDPPTTVFLLSMRAGAVGINLTAADHVFLMEPCINPALEDQAVGRSWRMGQQRPVTVKRFYVQGSIEEQILEVVRTRQHAAGGGGGSRRGNVRAQDTAGSIQSDRQQLRVSELETLFKDPIFPPPRVREPPSDEEEAIARLLGGDGGAAAAGAANGPDDSGPGASTARGGAHGRAAGGRPKRAAAAAGQRQRQRRQRKQRRQRSEESEDEEEEPEWESD